MKYVLCGSSDMSNPTYRIGFGPFCLLSKNSLFCILLILVSWILAHADTTTIACAANFQPALEELSTSFTSQSGHKTQHVYGATGGLYAQIVNGAPFDIFLSADDEKPVKLARDGLADSSTLFIYAVGQLVLWSPSSVPGSTPGKMLSCKGKISIAQPSVAPYGRAAEQAMQKMGVWNSVQGNLVFGMNIGQTFQFVSSNAACAGFVAYSQIIEFDQKKTQGHFWIVPDSLHDPIRQQAVLLKRALTKPSARQFLQFIQSRPAQDIIAKYGYSFERS